LNCAKSQHPSTQRGSLKVVAEAGSTYVLPVAAATALALAAFPAACAPDLVPPTSRGAGLRCFFAAGALGAAEVSASMRVVARRGARSVARVVEVRACIVLVKFPV
jgi:hypothetical protein